MKILLKQRHNKCLILKYKYKLSTSEPLPKKKKYELNDNKKENQKIMQMIIKLVNVEDDKHLKSKGIYKNLNKSKFLTLSKTGGHWLAGCLNQLIYQGGLIGYLHDLN